MTRFLFTVLTVSAIACPAFGAVTVGVDVSTGGSSVANALNITSTNPWFGANLFVELTQGSVVNLDPGLGGVNTAPTQGEININPALLFDTYVGRVGTTDDLAGGAVEIGGADPFDLGPTGIDVSWHVGLNTVPPLANESIGNLVFSDDASGTWSLGVVESGNEQVKYIGGTLSGGALSTDFLLGDVNVDNFTGIDDLNIVLGQWNTDGSADPRSDPSGDGFVGIDDLNTVLGGWNAGTAQGPWNYSPAGQPGDLNGDGWVGIDEFNILLQNWHQTVPPGDSIADPSGDGFVGLDDLSIVSNYWNTGTPPIVVVPEPAGLVLLSFATLGMMRKRRA